MQQHQMQIERATVKCICSLSRVVIEIMMLIRAAFLLFLFINDRSVRTEESNGDVISLIKKLKETLQSLAEEEMKFRKKVNAEIQGVVSKEKDLSKSIGENTGKIQMLDDSMKKMGDFKKQMTSLGNDVKKIGERLETPIREFKFDKRELSWSKAEEECSKWGGHLVTIKSQQENDFHFGTGTSRDMAAAWIGISDQKSKGKFEWISGDKSSYLNWHTTNGVQKFITAWDEPGQGCGRMGLSFFPRWKGAWSTANCDNEFPFICERWKDYDTKAQ